MKKFLFNSCLPKPPKPVRYGQMVGQVIKKQGKTITFVDEPQMIVDPNLSAESMSLKNLLDAGVPLREMNPKFVRTSMAQIDASLQDADLTSLSVEDLKDENKVEKSPDSSTETNVEQKTE